MKIASVAAVVAAVLALLPSAALGAEEATG